MDKLLLFIDGSVNNILKVGCGAYLLISEQQVSQVHHEDAIQIKKFSDTSSTNLELQTLLWALSEIDDDGKEIIVYTDSQNIIGLPARRHSLEEKDYLNVKNELLNNHMLYREFFKITDQMNCEFIKVAGHQPARNKSIHDRLFTLVDRRARKALKQLSE